MAQTPEGRVKDALRRRLNAEGWRYNTTTSRGRGRSGQADYTVNAGGFYIPIETKADKPEPTKLQHNELRQHADAGALGFVLARTGIRIYLPEQGDHPIEVLNPDGAPDVKVALDHLVSAIHRHIARNKQTPATRHLRR